MRRDTRRGSGSRPRLSLWRAEKGRGTPDHLRRHLNLSGVCFQAAREGGPLKLRGFLGGFCIASVRRNLLLILVEVKRGVQRVQR
jgi:hypothetical protein